MDDEKKKSEVEEKTTEESAPKETLPANVNTENRESPKRTGESDLPILDQARKVSEDMRKVNAETRALLDRRERMLAEEMVQGRAMHSLIEKKEETPQEYSKRVLLGEANPLDS